MYFALALYVYVQNGMKLLYRSSMEQVEVILILTPPSQFFFLLDVLRLNYHHSMVNLAEHIM